MEITIYCTEFVHGDAIVITETPLLLGPKILEINRIYRTVK